MDRDSFHLPGRHYFLSHSVGAQPKSWARIVDEMITAPWREAGSAVWDSWFGALERFKSGLAGLIGAGANDLVPVANVSSGIAKILFSLPRRPGRTKIILTEDDFPTVGFVLEQARRHGYELVFLPGGERLADPDSWARAFADDVQLVVSTHIYSNTNVMAPCAEIARRARKAGVFSLFDIAQSAGGIPIDLNSWAGDFAVGTSQKYLCGGPGAAFLWAARETAQQCAPVDVGWLSHTDPFEFDIHHFDYAPGAARFTGGTPSFLPFAGACAAHDIITKRSVDAIFAHNQALLSRLISALPRSAMISSTQEDARGNAALIKVRNYEHAAKALDAEGIHHDTRKSAVRVSFHLYNDDNDIDALAKTIEPFL